MKRFRNRPIVVTAELFDGSDTSADSLIEAFSPHVHRMGSPDGKWCGKLLIVLAEQSYLIVEPGDWIFRNPDGQVIPSNPDVFTRAFEPCP
jgi:hypothetical protein